MAIITKLKSSSAAAKMNKEDPSADPPPRKPIILKFKCSSSSAVTQDPSAATPPKRIILNLKRKITNEDQDPSPAAKRKKEDPSPSATAADLPLISLNYIGQGLKMSKEEIDKLKRLELNNLLGKKKLFLVLDLDHTLLHTVSKKRLTPEKQLLEQQDVSNGVIFRYKKKVTKLRPFVRPFLEEASKLFQLCVYTMGGRDYAQNMVSFLDPGNKYFGSRVISCEDNTRFERKGLDVVMAPENVVLIVDDTESVWDKHTANLIQIEKYNFFSAASSKGTASQTDAPSFSELLEREADMELFLVFNILQRAHRMFFEGHTSEERDVRNVMKSVWENLGRR